MIFDKDLKSLLIKDILIKIDKITDDHRKIYYYFLLSEVLIKFHSIIIICNFLNNFSIQSRGIESILSNIRKPSLGLWVYLIENLYPLFSEESKYWSNFDFFYEKVLRENFTYLINLRNDYYHGTVPHESKIRDDIEKIKTIVNEILHGKKIDNVYYYSLFYNTNLEIDKKIMESDDIYEVRATGEKIIELSPFIMYYKKYNNLILYNERLKNQIDYISYHIPEHIYEEKILNYFLEKIPLDKWKNISMNKFNEIIDELTIGYFERTNYTNAILEFIIIKKQGYILLYGSSGVGKSSILAYLYNLFRGSIKNSEKSKIQNYKVIEYFTSLTLITKEISFFLEFIDNAIEKIFSLNMNKGNTKEEKILLLNDKLLKIDKIMQNLENNLKGKDAKIPIKLIFLIDNIHLLSERFDKIFKRKQYTNIFFIVTSHKKEDIIYDMGLKIENFSKIELLNYLFHKNMIYDKEEIDLLYKKTEGNPFILNQISNLLLDKKIQINDLHAIDLKIRDLLSYKLEKYISDNNIFEVVLLLSIVREEISEDIMKDVLRINRLEIENILQTIVEIVSRIKITDYSFKYIILNENIRKYLSIEYHNNLKSTYISMFRNYLSNIKDLVRVNDDNESSMYLLKNTIPHSLDYLGIFVPEGETWDIEYFPEWSTIIFDSFYIDSHIHYFGNYSYLLDDINKILFYLKQRNFDIIINNNLDFNKFSYYIRLILYKEYILYLITENFSLTINLIKKGQIDQAKASLSYITNSKIRYQVNLLLLHYMIENKKDSLKIIELINKINFSVYEKIYNLIIPEKIISDIITYCVLNNLVNNVSLDNLDLDIKKKILLLLLSELQNDKILSFILGEIYKIEDYYIAGNIYISLLENLIINGNQITNYIFYLVVDYRDKLESEYYKYEFDKKILNLNYSYIYDKFNIHKYKNTEYIIELKILNGLKNNIEIDSLVNNVYKLIDINSEIGFQYLILLVRKELISTMFLYRYLINLKKTTEYCQFTELTIKLLEGENNLNHNVLINHLIKRGNFKDKDFFMYIRLYNIMYKYNIYKKCAQIKRKILNILKFEKNPYSIFKYYQFIFLEIKFSSQIKKIEINLFISTIIEIKDENLKINCFSDLIRFLYKFPFYAPILELHLVKILTNINKIKDLYCKLSFKIFVHKLLGQELKNINLLYDIYIGINWILYPEEKELLVNDLIKDTKLDILSKDWVRLVRAASVNVDYLDIYKNIIIYYPNLDNKNHRKEFLKILVSIKKVSHNTIQYLWILVYTICSHFTNTKKIITILKRLDEDFDFIYSSKEQADILIYILTNLNYTKINNQDLVVHSILNLSYRITSNQDKTRVAIENLKFNLSNNYKKFLDNFFYIIKKLNNIESEFMRYELLIQVINIVSNINDKNRIRLIRVLYSISDLGISHYSIMASIEIIINFSKDFNLLESIKKIQLKINKLDDINNKAICQVKYYSVRLIYFKKLPRVYENKIINIIKKTQDLYTKINLYLQYINLLNKMYSHTNKDVYYYHFELLLNCINELNSYEAKKSFIREFIQSLIKTENQGDLILIEKIIDQNQLMDLYKPFTEVVIENLNYLFQEKQKINFTMKLLITNCISGSVNQNIILKILIHFSHLSSPENLYETESYLIEFLKKIYKL